MKAKDVPVRFKIKNSQFRDLTQYNFLQVTFGYQVQFLKKYIVLKEDCFNLKLFLIFSFKIDGVNLDLDPDLGPGSGSKLSQNLGSGSKFNVFGSTTLALRFFLFFHILASNNPNSHHPYVTPVTVPSKAHPINILMIIILLTSIALRHTVHWTIQHLKQVLVLIKKAG